MLPSSSLSKFYIIIVNYLRVVVLREGFATTEVVVYVLVLMLVEGFDTDFIIVDAVADVGVFGIGVGYGVWDVGLGLFINLSLGVEVFT